MLRRILPFVLLGLLAPSAAKAQALPVGVDLDHATFAYGPDQSLLEVYLAFEANALPFAEEEDGGFRSRLPLSVSLVRSSDAALDDSPGGAVWSEQIPLSFVVADTSGIEAAQHFVHQLRQAVPPGEYELRVEVAPPQQPALELRRDVIVPDFAEADLVGLSDVTLANVIAPSEARDDVFYKNGLLVRPNPNGLYGQGLPQLYYYAEAYHTDALAGDDGQYDVFAYVAEANRPQPLPGLQKRSAREARSPDVLVGAFDLSSLPSGAYFFRLALLNDANEAVAEQARKFFVYNPEVERAAPPAVEATFEMSPYADMPEDELEQALGHIQTVATEREKRRLRRIEDVDERRRFLMAFWQKRDPDPSTPQNEYQEEFYRRLQYANDRYSDAFDEGWQKDRGQTLIKYGLPTNIEPHLHDRDKKPHEIWQYNNIPGEGQAVFVFADRSGYGTFELIHSTVTGERKLPDWELELVR